MKHQIIRKISFQQIRLKQCNGAYCLCFLFLCGLGCLHLLAFSLPWSHLPSLCPSLSSMWEVIPKLQKVLQKSIFCIFWSSCSCCCCCCSNCGKEVQTDRPLMSQVEHQVPAPHLQKSSSPFIETDRRFKRSASVILSSFWFQKQIEFVIKRRGWD